MEIIEKTGETIESAIDAGLQELGVGPDEVMVEVIEEPSRGLLGFGARPARVRLILMGGRKAPMPATPTPAASEAAPAPAKPVVQSERRSEHSETQGGDDESRRRRGRRGGRGRQRPGSAPAERRGGNASDAHDDHDDDDAYLTLPAADEIPEAEASEDARVAKEVLLEILHHMGFSGVNVGIRQAAAARQEEESHWILNISGKKVERLVGRKGETLAALQYLTRLIVSRRLQIRANIIVDAGEYKAQRSQRLEQLALRMAEQAVSQHRTIELEPMPPHERRIVHLTLRDRQDVETRSIGEGSGRKVTISPVS